VSTVYCIPFHTVSVFCLHSLLFAGSETTTMILAVLVINLQVLTTAAGKMLPIDLLKSLSDHFSCGSIGFVHPHFQGQMVEMSSLKELSKSIFTTNINAETIHKINPRDMGDCQEHCFPDLFVVRSPEDNFEFVKTLFSTRTHSDIGVWLIELPENSTKQNVISV